MTIESNPFVRASNRLLRKVKVSSGWLLAVGAIATFLSGEPGSMTNRPRPVAELLPVASIASALTLRLFVLMLPCKRRVPVLASRVMVPSVSLESVDRSWVVISPPSVFRSIIPPSPDAEEASIREFPGWIMMLPSPPAFRLISPPVPAPSELARIVRVIISPVSVVRVMVPPSPEAEEASKIPLPVPMSISPLSPALRVISPPVPEPVDWEMSSRA